MEKNVYLALLRGINIGGRNVIKMDALKEIFAELGFESIKTYIQSGNVLFCDHETDKTKLAGKIEEILFKKLNNEISVLVFEFSDIKKVIDKKPENFGEDSGKKYDVIYLLGELTPKDAMKEIKAREGVDEIYEGKKVLYISRSIKNLTKSYFSKIVQTPVYKNITVRNWKTTKNLYELMLTSE